MKNEILDDILDCLDKLESVETRVVRIKWSQNTHDRFAESITEKKREPTPLEKLVGYEPPEPVDYRLNGALVYLYGIPCTIDETLPEGAIQLVYSDGKDAILLVEGWGLW